MFQKLTTSFGIVLLTSSLAFAAQAPATGANAKPAVTTAKSQGTVPAAKTAKTKKHHKHHKKSAKQAPVQTPAAPQK
jgi:hypothetical protein